LDQTFPEFESIVVDDGSTDDTADVVARFGDERIRYIYQENQERSAARNRGLAMSQGEYVAFLDSDDMFLPHKLAVQVAALDDAPEVGLVTGGCISVDHNGRPLRVFRPWRDYPQLDAAYWLFRGPVQIGRQLVRKVWLERVHGFDVTMTCAEDKDLLVRLAIAGCKMAWVESVVSVYRLRSLNSAHDALVSRQGVLRLMDKTFATPGLPSEIQSSRDQAYAAAYLFASAVAYAAGQFDHASADLETAARLNPALVEGEPSQLLEVLVAQALTLPGTDPRSYFAGVLTHWPSRLDRFSSSRRRLLAHFYVAKMFQCYEVGHYAEALTALWHAVTRDPGWLRNRGVWSVAARCLARQVLARHPPWAPVPVPYERSTAESTSHILRWCAK
jgi:hypothetical protein